MSQIGQIAWRAGACEAESLGKDDDRRGADAKRDSDSR